MRQFAKLLLTSFLLPTFATAEQTADQFEPELAGAGQVATTPESQAAEVAKLAGVPIEAQGWMISAAHPLAVEAGAEILRSGGTAADAMVAVQVVLGLVEPQSSGLGGGAFLVWYDGESGELTTLDGRETAPLAATPTLFQDEAGEPLAFYDAVVGGRSVGTPGTVALLETAHQKWGTAEWPTLFVNGIALAENGFAVGPRLAKLIEGDADRLSRFQTTRDYFVPDGVVPQVGHILTNPEYAETLKEIAGHGAGAFYTGEIAEDIVETVLTAPGNPGVLSTLDLAIYQVKERAPVCSDYRGYQICGMGPPSSGALTVGQILGVLENFDLAALGPDDPQSWRLIGDATRLGFADRGRYMADSDFVPVPTKGLLDPAYLAERAELLKRDTTLEQALPGAPEFDHALNWADDISIELPSTSHISIVDQYGNALSMTTTIENAFGSRLMVRGFLLNNELTDFSFLTHDEGRPIANAIAPGKRPRSSMAPTIVLKDGKPVLVVGSPGGSRIISYVTKAIIAHLDWGMDVQEAASFPNMINRFGVYDLEAGTAAEELAQDLQAMGFATENKDMTSGVHAISINETLLGGADPRREGIALGN
ncbi:Gamma-glutamyltranspeptidase precursor [Roseovarius albus]|uniref:Glutathione hydrolase proenzyme n=1 Tax=Roseovarius albus TaxID=1247867 RepID=A0A1X7A7J5_9RHOB|nr:gamma-glutamyltransferase [Roseovarius albus]SLN72145.1 Gamma-glutamyltranspeptidase precursor [Roseovarius albus]